MIIANVTRINQLEEVKHDQEAFEAGLADGQIFWSCPIEMEKSIAYHRGYIQALKNRIYEMQFGISKIDPECGF